MLPAAKDGSDLLQLEAGDHLRSHHENTELRENWEMPESVEEALPYTPRLLNDPLLFCRLPSETRTALRCLSRAPIVLQRTPALTTSTPDIERAIQQLTAECGRAPSDGDVAKKLHIGLEGYRQIREYVRDIEAGNLFAKQSERSANEEAPYLLNGPEDDPLFHCLRSEMQVLLREAIEHVAEFDHLLLSFYYSEEGNSMALNAKLESAGPAEPETRTMAFVDVRASLADRELLTGSTVRPWWETDPFSLHTRSGLKVKATGNKCEDRKETHFFVTGSQSGWVPTKRSWKLFGWRDNWDRFFMSWYRMNEKQEITQIRRQERYTRQLGF